MNSFWGTTLSFLTMAPLLMVVNSAPTPTKPVLIPTQELAWADLQGNGYGTPQLRGAVATVFIFVSSECPRASDYASRLRVLEKEFFDKRIRVYLVDSHPSDTAQRLTSWAKERHLTVPLVLDKGGVLAARLGAKRTPEAVIVGREGEILYRGQIDDSADESLVRRHYVRESLEAILSGRPITQSQVPLTDGCLILKSVPLKASKITYTQHIAPILNQNCVSCHRKGEVAPFALDSYQQARLWAPMLVDVTERRIMPPWKAAPGYGRFHGTRALTETEIKTLAKWAKSGTPTGNVANLPAIPNHAATRAVGKPDLILTPDQPYNLEAEGKDEYRCFVLPIEFSDTTYIQGTQIRPGNTAVVHHVILYVVKEGKQALDADIADPRPGFVNPNAGFGPPLKGAIQIAGWAPGGTSITLPKGIAHIVPKGSRLVMEVHYHRSGKPEQDLTTIGLTFSKEPVQKQLLTFMVYPNALHLPADNASIPVSASWPVTENYTILSVAPHMHQIGKQMHMWAEHLDTLKEELIWVKNWDFQWQTTYLFQKPVHLPKGSTVQLHAIFDNSAKNPRNPNRPPQAISWGEASSDEMCIGYLQGTKNGQDLKVVPSHWQKTVHSVKQ